MGLSSATLGTMAGQVMGAHANRRITNYLAGLATAVILTMNVWLLFAIVIGKS